jgi:hypothetical protein
LRYRGLVKRLWDQGIDSSRNLRRKSPKAYNSVFIFRNGPSGVKPLE